MVDLLAQHHRNGLRFQPTEFVEDGPRVAVRMAVSDPGRPERGETYKVFTFREPDDRAALLQDCTGRDDALAYLRTEEQP